MVRTPRVHVVPKNGDWAVKSEGAGRAHRVVDTQAKAIEVGRLVAQNRGTELVIHRPNGQIRDSDSYGNDPASSHDSKH
jgi:Uncharacterized protein conserved in bacteria (DUF2188)